MSSRRSQIQQFISQIVETVVVVINASTPSGASPVGNGDGIPRFSDGTTPFSGTGIGELYASGEEIPEEDIVTTALPVVASLPASYSVTVSERYVSEGGRRVTFSICASNVADGTVVYWENIGTSDASDFNENVNSGFVTINKSLGSVNFTIIADGLTEGNETLQLRVRTGSLSGEIVALSEVVNIADTPTYSISASASSILEGNGSITFTITTTNVADGTTLYWQNIGTTTSTDFAQNLNSGVVVIYNNTGTVSFTPIVDTLTNESTETVILRLRTLSNSGPIVATSVTVNVFNFSPIPIYAIVPNVTTVNESGSSVVFTVSTANVNNGTTLYWENIGTAGASDFTQGLNSGTVTINSNSGTITFTTVADSTTEGPETLQVRIRTGSLSGTIVATSSSVTITDSSTTVVTPTYAIAPNVPSLDEAGSSVVFTVTTTNVSNGTTLYWENIGTAGASDFTQGLNSGTVTINSNSGTITFTTVADLTTEGSETLQVRIRTGSLSGTIVATSSSVTITDTSLTPEPTYAIAPDVSSINEAGASVIFTITTTNVANGTPLYWEDIGTAGASDFTQNAASGTVTINSNSGTITFTTVADLTLEGSETLQVRLRTGSLSGTIVATSSVVTITDSSVPSEVTFNSLSFTGGLGNDVFVATYNPSGKLLWAARTAGSSSASAWRAVIAEDRSVYVLSQFQNSTVPYNADGTAFGTTYTVASSSHNGALLVKYSSTGVVQWGAKMQCAGNVIPYGLGIDSSGNAYVCGTYPANLTTFNSDGTQGSKILTFSGTTSDVYLVKYNSSGIVDWNTRITSIAADSVFSLALDANNSIFMAVRVPNNANGNVVLYDSDDVGTLTIPTSTSVQMTVIVKYSSGGIAQSANKLTSIAYDIAFDSTKTNFYISGTGTTTAYNLDGSTFGSLSGLGNEDVYLVKYDSGCNPLWMTRMGGSVQEAPSGLAVDSGDNIYIYGRFLSGPFTLYNQPGTSNSGITLTPIGSHDYFLAKYNSSGTAQWATQIGGTGIDQPASLGIDSRIASDGLGNVYMSGRFTSSILDVRNVGGTAAYQLTNAGTAGTNYDGFYAKYNSSGIAQWVSHIRMAGANEAPCGVWATSTGYNVLTATYGNNGVDILSG